MKKFILIAIFSLATIAGFAQGKTVTGTVKGEDGLPIPGANIMAKGTQFGTITAIDGTFALKMPNRVKYIEISYIGMIPQIYDVTERRVINAVLVEDTEKLEEMGVKFQYKPIRDVIYIKE